MNKTKKEISVEVEFTDGYQERFTAAIMKIYEKRMRKGELNESGQNNKSA